MPTVRAPLQLVALLSGATLAGAVSDGWHDAGRPSPDERVTFMLSLHSADKTALGSSVTAVSDPESLRFRQYLSGAQIRALVAPPAVALREVESELIAAGATVVRGAHGSGQVLHVTARVAAAERLLRVSLRTFAHAVPLPGGRRRTAIRSLRSQTATLSEALAAHVAAIHGVDDLLPPPATWPPTGEAMPDGECTFKGDTVDPAVIAKQYRTAGVPPATGATSQVVAAFEQAEFRPSDVADFQAAYSLPRVNFSVVGDNTGGYFGEASLDTQYITASGPGVPSTFLYQDMFDMLAFCEAALNLSTTPSVFSISWGAGESAYSVAHMRAADACFQRAALKGVTILAASGDQGTGRQGGTFGFGCKRFDPTWPASAPHVTAVGGTVLQGGSESGWAGSGGGFSAVFDRPRYQAAAAEQYLASSTLPPAGLFNSSGRATPDVASLATCYTVFTAGYHGLLSGTSAATPTFAGMISRINDARVAAGKPTLGFLNPALYAAGGKSGIGTKIAQGDNKAAGCPAGFVGSSGSWDAVTGLGTPLWPTLSALLMH